MKEQEAQGLRVLHCERCQKRWWHNPHSLCTPTDDDGFVPPTGDLHLRTGVFEFTCTCGASGMVPVYLKRKKH